MHWLQSLPRAAVPSDTAEHPQRALQTPVERPPSAQSSEPLKLMQASSSCCSHGSLLLITVTRFLLQLHFKRKSLVLQLTFQSISCLTFSPANHLPGGKASPVVL